MDLEGQGNNGMEKFSDLEEKKNLKCHALEEGCEMELGVLLWVIGSLHFELYTQPRICVRKTHYEVGMTVLEDQDDGLWHEGQSMGNCMEGWGWMGHEDYGL